MRRDLTDTAYAIPADIDDRLLNWARWAKVRGWQSSCGSIEKFYQPAAGNTMQEVTPFERADLWDAWEIERTWSVRMPQREKMVLKAAYIVVIRPLPKSTDAAKKHERLLCKIAGCQRQDWPRVVYMAAVMMRNLAKAPHLVRRAA